MTTKDIKEISKIISCLKNAEEIEAFLIELLTETELKDIANRWNILKLLSKNTPQRNISKQLTVSLCKITRGSKILKNDKCIIRKILFDENWRG